MIVDHDQLFELLFLRHYSISHRILINQHSAEAPIATVRDAEGQLEDVRQVSYEILLECGVTERPGSVL